MLHYYPHVGVGAETYSSTPSIDTSGGGGGWNPLCLPGPMHMKHNKVNIP